MAPGGAVEVTGVFYKRWAYPAQDGTRTAPLVVANVPVWRRSDLDLAAGRTGLSPVELGAAIIAALLMAACVTVVLWRRTQRRRPRDEFGPPNISSLSNLTLAPTPRDSLRRLEQDAKQGEA